MMINRTEDPETMLYTQGHLIFYQEAKRYMLEKRLHLQQTVLFKMDGLMQKNKNGFVFITLQRTKVQIDQRLQHQTRYSKSDKRTHWDQKGFSAQNTVAQSLRPEINRWDFMKLKSFLYSKVHHNLSKVAAYRLVKLFTNYTPDRTLVFRIFKELK